MGRGGARQWPGFCSWGHLPSAAAEDPHPCGFRLRQAPPPGQRRVGAVGRVPRVQEWVWVGASPPPSFPASLPPSLPDGFPLAATRAVTHAVKIPPSPGNYKQKMRLDSRALPGIRARSTDTPGKGLGAVPGPCQGGAGGSPSTPAQRGTPRTPSQRRGAPTASAPGSGGFSGSESHRERGGGRRCSSGGLLPLQPRLGWKSLTPRLSHAPGNPPKQRRDPRQQELIAGIGN